jgi:hypothetical protein
MSSTKETMEIDDDSIDDDNDSPDPDQMNMVNSSTYQNEIPTDTIGRAPSNIQPM